MQENQLREENKRLRTQLEVNRAEQSREPPRPFSRPGKGKEIAASDDLNLPADDELSSGSSPLPRRSLSPNSTEAHSKRRPPRRPSRSISIARRRVRRELSRDQRPVTPAPQYAPNRAEGFPPPGPSLYQPYGVAPVPQMIARSAARGHWTYFPLPLGSIFWTMILLADFLFRSSPCTMVQPTHMIICYITIKP